MRRSADWTGRLAALLLSAALGGCAIAPLGPPGPSMENIAAARAAGIPPLALGTFRLAPGGDPSMDQKISIRTNVLHSPVDNSFAAYLKAALAADLRAAGLLDPASATVLSGELTESRIDVPSGQASASLAARFRVARGSVALYDRELRVADTWTAGFVGAEAVPMAVNHYEVLYRKLTKKLLEDREFRAAVSR